MIGGVLTCFHIAALLWSHFIWSGSFIYPSVRCFTTSDVPIIAPQTEIATIFILYSLFCRGCPLLRVFKPRHVFHFLFHLFFLFFLDRSLFGSFKSSWVVVKSLQIINRRLPVIARYPCYCNMLVTYCWLSNASVANFLMFVLLL